MDVDAPGAADEDRGINGELNNLYRTSGMGLHSSTSRLNVSTFCGIRWVCG